jgi:transposase
MISAVTATGSFKYDIVTGTLDADKFIDFCDKLLTDTDGPVFLVVDGHPVHRSKDVKEYVASTSGQLRLFRLPSYSPELNPDEWVWKNVKHDRLGRAGITTANDLKAKATNALRRLQRLPHLIRAFFADPHLRYITT